MQVNDLVESEKDKKEQIRGQLPLDFFPEKQPTLSNFIVGSNSEAVAVISELKEGRGPQFTYLWGYEGVGKHTSYALWANKARGSCFRRKPHNLRRRQCSRSDAGTTAGAVRSLQHRARAGTHLVVTADRSPKDFERQGFRKDLTSRFSWGVVFELSPLSDEQKRQVILEAASQTGLKVAPEVLNWIENNFPRDMHTMSNLLHSLDRYAMSAKRAVTIPLIKEWLERNQDTKEDR
ncbi:MAG: HdaA/DnaA family protein [Parasutterella excrementihominis]